MHFAIWDGKEHIEIRESIHHEKPYHVLQLPRGTHTCLFGGNDVFVIIMQNRCQSSCQYKRSVDSTTGIVLYTFFGFEDFQQRMFTRHWLVFQKRGKVHGFLVTRAQLQPILFDAFLSKTVLNDSVLCLNAGHWIYLHPLSIGQRGHPEFYNVFTNQCKHLCGSRNPAIEYYKKKVLNVFGVKPNGLVVGILLDWTLALWELREFEETIYPVQEISLRHFEFAHMPNVYLCQYSNRLIINQKHVIDLDKLDEILELKTFQSQRERDSNVDPIMLMLANEFERDPKIHCMHELENNHLLAIVSENDFYFSVMIWDTSRSCEPLSIFDLPPLMDVSRGISLLPDQCVLIPSDRQNILFQWSEQTGEIERTWQNVHKSSAFATKTDRLVFAKSILFTELIEDIGILVAEYLF